MPKCVNLIDFVTVLVSCKTLIRYTQAVWVPVFKDLLAQGTKDSFLPLSVFEDIFKHFRGYVDLRIVNQIFIGILSDPACRPDLAKKLTPLEFFYEYGYPFGGSHFWIKCCVQKFFGSLNWGWGQYGFTENIQRRLLRTELLSETEMLQADEQLPLFIQKVNQLGIAAQKDHEEISRSFLAVNRFFKSTCNFKKYTDEIEKSYSHLNQKSPVALTG